jgi:hypothetical protein
MMLALLACGQGSDTPTPRPAGLAGQGSKAAEKDLTTLRDRFTWGDTSQPARDWDVDADACKGRADEDPGVRAGAHPLARVGVFVKCMGETGWAFDADNR